MPIGQMTNQIKCSFNCKFVFPLSQKKNILYYQLAVSRIKWLERIILARVLHIYWKLQKLRLTRWMNTCLDSLFQKTFKNNFHPYPAISCCLMCTQKPYCNIMKIWTATLSLQGQWACYRMLICTEQWRRTQVFNFHQQCIFFQYSISV